MIIHQIPFKDFADINGERIWIWSVIIRSDGVIKVKTEKGKLIQMLPGCGLSLDGHYTILWRKDNIKDIVAYQHGGWGNLISIIPLYFKGFIELNEFDKLHLQILVRNTMRNYRPYTYGCYMSTGVAFDYNFDLHGIPEFMEALKLKL